jgi:hypothetical protein
VANRKHTKKEIAALRTRRQAAHHAVPEYKDPNQVLTIPQWCARNTYSNVAGRKFLLSGKGPPLLKLSVRRYGVRVGDDNAWKDRLAKQA